MRRITWSWGLSPAGTAVAVLAILALFLSACGTIRTVGIPTPVACKVNLPTKPDFAFDNLPAGSDIFTQVSTLLADRRQRIDYERQVETAARSCS